MLLEPIFKAFEVTDADLMDRLKISDETVRLWRRGHRKPTPERAIEIEEKFNIPRHMLRPDLWGGA